MERRLRLVLESKPPCRKGSHAPEQRFPSASGARGERLTTLVRHGASCVAVSGWTPWACRCP